MPTLLDIPEKAVIAFETATKLTVTVHDRERILWPFLSPQRFHHIQPCCQVVKEASRDVPCRAFELEQLPSQLRALPEGRIHICHAGLVEFVVPVFLQTRLAAILFAGVRRAGPGLTEVVREPASAYDHASLCEVAPGRIEDREAAVYLELLRQLGARLNDWYRRYQRNSGHASGATRTAADRRLVIGRFLEARHTDPSVCLATLAAALYLSPDRTAHIVKELFERTFLDLLVERRLRTAASWLRHSDSSVLDIALRSGFGDVSHFHRRFKRFMGVTPHAYRRQARAEAAR